jgi:hypothetical protein
MAQCDVLTGTGFVHLHNLQLQKSPSRIFGQNSGNSIDISKAFFVMVIWKFESSEVSQAVLFLESFLSLTRKARQMRAFLIANSLWRPTFELFGPRIPKSLQPNPRKLPFSGDSPWRLALRPKAEFATSASHFRFHADKRTIPEAARTSH